MCYLSGPVIPGQPLFHGVQATTLPQPGFNFNPAMMLETAPAGNHPAIQFRGPPPCQHGRGTDCGNGLQICQQMRQEFEIVHDSLRAARRRFTHFLPRNAVSNFLGPPHEYAERRRRGVFLPPLITASISEREVMPGRLFAQSLGLDKYADRFPEPETASRRAKKRKSRADNNRRASGGSMSSFNLQPQAASNLFQSGSPMQGAAALFNDGTLLASGGQQGVSFQPDPPSMAPTPPQNGGTTLGGYNPGDLTIDPSLLVFDGKLTSINSQENEVPMGRNFMDPHPEDGILPHEDLNFEDFIQNTDWSPNCQ